MAYVCTVFPLIYPSIHTYVYYEFYPVCTVHTIYALTFAGLNFRSFRGSIDIRESFILQKFRPDGQHLCNYITNCDNNNAKTTKIGNLRMFNPAKVIAYTVY